MYSIPMPREFALASFAIALRKAGKNTLLLFSVAVVLATASAASGQSALDGFDPRPNNLVRVVVVQPDGKILIGGDFTTLSPNGGATVTRNRIARLNPDGTLDTAFDPNANGRVHAIALQADGKVLVGGEFSGANSIGGQTRNRIARLDAATGSADSFDPNASDVVYSIALQADGKILVGGGFNSVGSQTRGRLARLDPTTGAADSLNLNTSGQIFAIWVQTDGKILIGGNFTSLGSQTRNRIARLDSNTGAADSFDPNASGAVYSFALQADGKILVGGQFTSIGGQTRNRIARLDPTSGLADSFDPNANVDVVAIAVQTDGKILAAGFFTSIGGQTRNRIARLDPTTGLADSFDPNANDAIRTIAVQADGKILAGGGMITVTPNGGPSVIRPFIARLEADGRLDRTLNLSIVSGYVLATAVQPDGKILIGGFFTSVLGVPRKNMARLNSDGTLDTAFNPNANDDANSLQGDVNVIAVQADGKILAGGYFTNIGGQPRNRIARLDAATGLADSFNPNANASVDAIALQADGKILAGGNFTNIGGQPRNRIARLDATTGLADSFDANANATVGTIAVQFDGKILTGGLFTSIGGQTRNRIARLDATTGLADSFNPNASSRVNSIAVQGDGKVLAGGAFATIGLQTRLFFARLDPVTGLADSFNANANAFVYSIAVQADGKILVGGDFTTIGGQTRNRLARLDATTGLADSFDPNADGIVNAITLQADGKILVGGNPPFTTVGGQPRSLFARLSNDTAALQNLEVMPTTVTWTRGGASPQFTRVTFESSTDQVNYTLLGNGTASGSNWSLTGLSLPTGQNFYIRARGHHRGGFNNGSESITESVRNAFFTSAPAAPTIRFSSANYSVREFGQTVAVNITRTGDTTAPASVNFTTSDGAGSQNCSVNNGVASARCDYVTNTRTVQFAAGEASKIVPVLIVDDSYQEGDETFNVTLSDPTGAMLGSPSEATVTITDDDPVNGPNPITTAGFFVRQHYLDFLNREPDGPGGAFWSNNIDKCSDPSQRPPDRPTEAGCIDRQRETTSGAFFLSDEFQLTGYFVYLYYTGALGRVPTYREFERDAQEVATGVVVNNQWSPEVLNQNRAAFARAFILRAEFQALYDGLNNRQYVDKLFQSTGIQATENDKASLAASLNNLTDTRATVLHKIVEGIFINSDNSKTFTTPYGQDYYLKQFNAGFVQMEYFGYLRRDPDAAGYQHWKDKLDFYSTQRAGNYGTYLTAQQGEYIKAEMVRAFIVSDEYRRRFGP